MQNNNTNSFRMLPRLTFALLFILVLLFVLTQQFVSMDQPPSSSTSTLTSSSSSSSVSYSSSSSSSTSSLASLYSSYSPSSSSSSTPSVPRIVFIKTHKTASSTLSTLLLYLGYYHQKTFLAGPKQYDIEGRNNFFTVSSFADFATHHHLPGPDFPQLMTWYEERIPNAFRITTLREPTSRILSHYFYFETASIFKVLDHHMRRYLQTLPSPSSVSSPSSPSSPSTTTKTTKVLARETLQNSGNTSAWFHLVEHQMLKWALVPDSGNSMARDLGIRNRQEWDLYQHEILDSFFFIIVEHFDESLILLSRRLGLRLDDVVYLPMKRCQGFCPPKLNDLSSLKLKKRLRQVNDLDYLLYEAAKEKVQKEIESLGQELQEELGTFRNMLNVVARICNTTGTTGLNSGLIHNISYWNRDSSPPSLPDLKELEEVWNTRELRNQGGQEEQEGDEEEGMRWRKESELDKFCTLVSIDSTDRVALEYSIMGVSEPLDSNPDWKARWREEWMEQNQRGMQEARLAKKVRKKERKAAKKGLELERGQTMVENEMAERRTE